MKTLPLSRTICVLFFIFAAGFTCYGNNAVNSTDARINDNIDKYMPVYCWKDWIQADQANAIVSNATSDDSYNAAEYLLNTPYFLLEISNPFKTPDVPMQTIRGKFLGYSTNKSELVLSYGHKKQKQVIGRLPLQPGNYSMTHEVREFSLLKNKDVKKYRLEIKIEVKSLPIKITNSGRLWKNYDDTKVYWVTVRSKEMN